MELRSVQLNQYISSNVGQSWFLEKQIKLIIFFMHCVIK